MSLKIDINKIKSFIFYFAWVLMEIYICIANSSIPTFSMKYISYLCFVLFSVKIVLTKYKTKEIFKVMLILILCGLATYKCGDSRVLWFGLVICAAKNIDFNKLVKISFITMLCCVFTFIILYLFGFTSGAIVDYNKGKTYGFGLGHPNMFSAYYNLLILHYIFLNFKKINFLHIVFFTFIAFFVYLLSKSVSGAIVFFSMIVALIIYNDNIFKNNNKRSLLKKFFPLLVITGIILFTILPLFYNSNISFFTKLDDIFTGRLSQANFYYQKYGIKFFGSNLFTDLNNRFLHAILDIGYTRMLIYNGMIYYFLIVIPLILLIYKYYDEKKYPLLILLSTMAIYMFTENVSTYIFMNVSMILYTKYLFKDVGDKIEKK